MHEIFCRTDYCKCSSWVSLAWSTVQINQIRCIFLTTRHLCGIISAAAERKHRDVAQLGRALRSGRRGRRFKSCHPDHSKTRRSRAISLAFFVWLVHLLAHLLIHHWHICCRIYLNAHNRLSDYKQKPKTSGAFVFQRGRKVKQSWW